MNQPDRPYYGIEELFLFTRYNREEWRKAFRSQAPPWDKTRQIKRWVDQQGDAPSVGYQWFDPVTQGFKKFNLSGTEAGAVNLPGLFEYDKWVPRPTPAVARDPRGESPVNPETLCAREEAVALAGVLAATGLFSVGPVTEVSLAGGASYDWRGETRRQWAIKIGSDRHSASFLLKYKYAQGIGAPGKWIGTDASGPLWIAERQDTTPWDNAPEIPIPCRPLAENEKLHITPFGVTIYRTDMDSPYNQRPPAEGGGAGAGLTGSQAAQLERIDIAVQELLARA